MASLYLVISIYKAHHRQSCANLLMAHYISFTIAFGFRSLQVSNPALNELIIGFLCVEDTAIIFGIRDVFPRLCNETKPRYMPANEVPLAIGTAQYYGVSQTSSTILKAILE
jgi:hypothetical protein